MRSTVARSPTCSTSRASTANKLTSAGFATPEAVGGLDAISALPLTGKDEIRQTRNDDNPVGDHCCVPTSAAVRIFSTSGTTGMPSFIPLTPNDLHAWTRISARSYTASGLKAGEGLISTYGAGPFVAGVTFDAFGLIGVSHIPIGSGNTERLMTSLRLLKPSTIALTPSYALHLAEWARDRGIDTAASSVRRLLVAGEPGGGEPAMRAKLEAAWGAMVTEIMGIGDIAASLWGECAEQHGMHFSGGGFVHFELIDPDTGAALPIEDGAEGELVYTHLCQEGVPLLRFRSRDHVRIWTGPCACGRTAPRVRCIGRTDDMLIVRGVNVFPSALREDRRRVRPGGHRRDFRAPARQGLPSEPAAQGRRRARRRGGGRPRQPHQDAHTRSAPGHHRHRAGAGRGAAAQRVQVEAGRLVGGAGHRLKNKRRPGEAPLSRRWRPASDGLEGLALDRLAEAFHRLVDRLPVRQGLHPLQPRLDIRIVLEVGADHVATG